MAEDVVQFMQQLKLEKAALIGHSMYDLAPPASPTLFESLSFS